MSNQPAEPDLLDHLANRQQLKEADFALMMTLFSARRSPSAEKDALFSLYAETLGESLLHGQDDDMPDCRKCGACCAYFHHIPVQLYDPTPQQMTWQVYETDDPEERPENWLRRLPATGHCIAFEGEIGVQATCAMYELRPVACRAFEAGSDRCHALRRLYQLERPLSETELQRHENIIVRTPAGSESCLLPMASTSERTGSETAELLHEMIAFNSEILLKVESEIARLQNLFEGRGESHAVGRCRESIQEIIDNRLAIRDTLKPISSASSESGAGIHQLLQIGDFSQRCVESASEEVIRFGELWMRTSEEKQGASDDEESLPHNLSSPRQ